MIKFRVPFYAFWPMSCWLNTSQSKQIIILSIYRLSCPGLKSSIAGTLSYCIFTVSSIHKLCWSCTFSDSTGALTWCKNIQRFNPLSFLLTFVPVCLIILETLPQTSGFPQTYELLCFRLVVRSGLNAWRKEKKKKFCYLVNAALLLNGKGTELSASNVESSYVCSRKEHLVR